MKEKKEHLEPFDDATLESISEVLGDCVEPWDVAPFLEKVGFSSNLSNLSYENWDLIGEEHPIDTVVQSEFESVFSKSQEETGRPYKILEFIEELLNPKRFANRRDEFEEHRTKLNNVLMMVGLQFCKDGKIIRVKRAKTLDEVEELKNAFLIKLKERTIHEKVRKRCEKKLRQGNYSSAVFEAAKELSERISELSGVNDDGVPLVDKVFFKKNPLLKINKLETDPEKFEQKGFATLLKGVAQMLRNSIAHEPETSWEKRHNMTDVADYLSLISLLHRKLDKATRTKPKGT